MPSKGCLKHSKSRLDSLGNGLVNSDLSSRIVFMEEMFPVVVTADSFV